MIIARMTSRIPAIHIEGGGVAVPLIVVAVLSEEDPEGPTVGAEAQVQVFQEEAELVIEEAFAIVIEMVAEDIPMVERTIVIAKVDILIEEMIKKKVSTADTTKVSSIINSVIR